MVIGLICFLCLFQHDSKVDSLQVIFRQTREIQDLYVSNDKLQDFNRQLVTVTPAIASDSGTSLDAYAFTLGFASGAFALMLGLLVCCTYLLKRHLVPMFRLCNSRLDDIRQVGHMLNEIESRRINQTQAQPLECITTDDLIDISGSSIGHSAHEIEPLTGTSWHSEDSVYIDAVDIEIHCNDGSSRTEEFE